MRMKPLSYHDLLDAMPQPGCPVCRLLARDMDAFLSSLMYERFMVPETHDALRRARGLCNTHSWALIKQGNALGVATVYAAVLDELLGDAGRAPASSGKGGLGRFFGGAGAGLAEALEPRGPCLACALRDDSQARYLKTIGEHLADADFVGAYKESSGLCLPHFRLALRQVRHPDHVDVLVTLQLALWQRLRAELELFREKNDYRYTGQLMGTEGDSWQRAIAALAGGKDVFD